MSVAKRNEKKKCEKRKLRVSRKNPSNTGYSTYIPLHLLKNHKKLLIRKKRKEAQNER